MVEVPLEIEAQLPRDFEGSARLASSGLPRRVRMRAPKDSLKLSTAYRTDQLAGEIVRTVLRGTANDIMRVQDAVMKFIRAVRERRQDGATLIVSSNGRGKIDVVEQLPARVTPPPAVVAAAPEPPRPAPAPDRLAGLERRVADLESALSRVAPSRDLADRIAALEDRFPTAPIYRTPSHPLDEDPDRSPAPPRRATAIEAYAEGLRMELRTRATAAAARARAEMERGDRAAALAAALCAWQLVEPKPGQPLETGWHEALDTGGTEVVALVCPGLKRADGTAITAARVLVNPKPKETPLAPEVAAPAPATTEVTPGEASAPVATLEAVQPPATNGLAATALSPEPPPPALPVEPVASALPARPVAVTPLALLPAANGSVLSLLELAGETEIRPEEAAAAAAAAARATKVVA